MLVSMAQILDKANREGYAVIAPNVSNLETIKAAVEAAEEEKSPIILAYGEGLEKYIDIYDFGNIAKNAAIKSHIPIAIHLDHSFNFETCIKAINAGFTSIMIDRSSKPYEDNLNETKEMVRIAHAAGISVEAELGHVGLGSDYGDEESDNLTDPYVAAKFVKETSVDALAVAIGTAHGLYKSEPKIDFERLRHIKEEVSIPLVLHGGSMTGDKNLAKACQTGINKINIGTELDIEAMNAFMSNDANIVTGWELVQRLALAKDAVKIKIKHYINVFGSKGMAT